MMSPRLCLGVLAAALMLPSVASTADTDRASASELVIATYNLRFASDEAPNAWPDRRPVVKALLDRYQPDLIGTQEGLYHQLKDIAADQPDLRLDRPRTGRWQPRRIHGDLLPA